MRKTIPISKLLERLKTDEKNLIAGDSCPNCKMQKLKVKNIGKLVMRRGVNGLFLGCSKYPGCKYTKGLWK